MNKLQELLPRNQEFFVGVPVLAQLPISYAVLSALLYFSGPQSYKITELEGTKGVLYFDFPMKNPVFYSKPDRRSFCFCLKKW